MDIMLDTEMLKSLRKKKCWTQEKLAANADLSLRTVQRAEGKGTSSSETVLALASALDTTTDALTSRKLTGAKADAVQAQKENSNVTGYVCAAIGLFCAYLAITYSVINGFVELGVAAMWYGGIASFTGAVLGIAGVLLRKNVNHSYL